VSRAAHPLARLNPRAPLVWLVPLAALAAFVAVLAGDANRTLFLEINRLGPLTSDALWANLTVLGDTVVALALCLPFWRRRPDIVWAVALAGLLATLWVHALKPSVQWPRPPAVLGEQVHVIGTAYRRHAFPSGHATTLFYVAGLVAMGAAAGAGSTRRPPGGTAQSEYGFVDAPHADAPRHRRAMRALATVAIALAALAALSRCVVGVHWPLDVLAGAFGGWLAAAAGIALAQRTLAFGGRAAAQWSVGLVLVGCAAALVIGYDSEYPQAGAFQRVLGVLCLASAALTFRPRGSSARDVTR
jgi:membrane-associated phospholipid phosphatase